MNPVNIIGGGVLILAGLIGMVRPQWMVRHPGNKSDTWLNPNLAQTRRIVCAGLMIVGLIIALKGLTSPSR
jgi:hypothetical protein